MRFDRFVAAASLLAALTGCAQVNDAFQDLRRASSEPGDAQVAPEARGTAIEPSCWWEQPYQTVCARAQAGGGQVCRPVPAGQPVMRCIGPAPRFPYQDNRP